MWLTLLSPCPVPVSFVVLVVACSVIFSVSVGWLFSRDFTPVVPDRSSKLSVVMGGVYLSLYSIVCPLCSYKRIDSLQSSFSAISFIILVTQAGIRKWVKFWRKIFFPIWRHSKRYAPWIFWWYLGKWRPGSGITFYFGGYLLVCLLMCS